MDYEVEVVCRLAGTLVGWRDARIVEGEAFFKKCMIPHVQYHNFEYVYCSYGLTRVLSRTALRHSKLHVTVFS